MPGLSVEEAATVYAEEFQNYRRLSAEAVFLKPLGLDTESFISRQREMDQTVVQDLVHNLRTREIDASAIIVGRNILGHHIYAVHDPGEAYCTDAVGFCAVGTGRRYAEAQFMSAGYSQHIPWERGLLVTYRAKKRAEVSPGVGSRTNVYVLANTFSELDSVIHQRIAESYRKLEQEIEKTIVAEEQELRDFLPGYLKAKQEKPLEPSLRPDGTTDHAIDAVTTPTHSANLSTT